MEKGKVHIDELFRQKAQQQPLPLPPGAWNDLKPRLDKGKPRLSFRWWYVLPILLLISAGFFMLKSNPFSQTVSTPSAMPRPEITNRPLQSTSTSSNPSEAALPATNPNHAQKPQSISPQKYVDTTHEHNQTAQPDAGLNTVSSSKPASSAEKQKGPARDAVSAIATAATPSSQAGHPNAVTAAQPPATALPQSPEPVTSQQNSEQERKEGVSIPPSVAPLTMRMSTKDTPKKVAPKAFISPSGQTAQTTPSGKSSATDSVSSPTVSAKAEPAIKAAATTDTSTRNTGAINNPDTQQNQRPRRKQLPLSFGLKAGYEAGAGTPSFNKFIAAPFLRYSFGSGLSLSLQPAIKSGNARGFTVPDSKSYYSLTGTTVDSQTILRNGRPFWEITYTHGYDSITVTYTAGTNAVEFELPLLLHYSLKNGLFFGGGPQLSFGGLPAITEQRQTSQQTQTAVFQIEKAGTHPPPDTSKSFNHTATPYTSYVSQEQAAQSPVRIGYQLNAGYEYKRWLIEAGLQQTLSGLGGVSSPQVKDAYSRPYFRLLAGYRFGRK